MRGSCVNPFHVGSQQQARRKRVGRGGRAPRFRPCRQLPVLHTEGLMSNVMVSVGRVPPVVFCSVLGCGVVWCGGWMEVCVDSLMNPCGWVPKSTHGRFRFPQLSSSSRGMHEPFPSFVGTLPPLLGFLPWRFPRSPSPGGGASGRGRRCVQREGRRDKKGKGGGSIPGWFFFFFFFFFCWLRPRVFGPGVQDE